MLNQFAIQLDRTAWKRHLLFLVASLLALLAVGYHYGTFDMGIHIPFLKAAADPNLFPNDPYIALRSTYFSYFWFFFIPFYNAGHLAEAFFAVHFVSIYLVFWSVWEISLTLFKNPLSALLSVVAFIIPHLGFVGFPIIEFGVMSRTFVLPFTLFAINLFLRRRYLHAFLLAGLMYNLHVVTVNFILAMFLLDCVLEFKRIGLKNILLGLAGFVFAALPVLWWKANSAAPVDFSLRPDWFWFLVRGIMENVFLLFSKYPQIDFLAASGFCALGLFIIARKKAPAPEHDTTAAIFVLASLIVLAVGQVMAYWLPMTILIQSQINRAGLFILILAYIYFANLLALRWQNESEHAGTLALAAGFFLSLTPIIVIVVWALQKWLPQTRKVQIRLAVGTVILFLAILIPSYIINLWSPGVEIYRQDTPWVDVQLWARDNTPKSAVFITPPEKFWLYEADWRVYSERSTVSTYTELLVAAFNPQYTDTWIERFTAIAPGALEQFDGDYFANARYSKAAYYTLTPTDITQVACRYRASYIVIEKPHTFPYPVAYENRQFSVYDLRQQACLASLSAKH